MTLELWLHLAHILGAIVWVGGGLLLYIVATRIQKSGDVGVLTEFARTLPYVGLRVLMPAVVIVIVTGVWMVLISAEWDFTQLWVLLALGAFALAFLIGAIYLSRVGTNLERTAARADADIEASRAALGRWITGYRVVLLILLFAVWDMVFKPGI